jgi:hypothetical protein
MNAGKRHMAIRAFQSLEEILHSPYLGNRKVTPEKEDLCASLQIKYEAIGGHENITSSRDFVRRHTAII